MQSLTGFSGNTIEIEIVCIVSKSGTLKGTFPTTNFEMKIFILKFVKNATFYPNYLDWA